MKGFFKKLLGYNCPDTNQTTTAKLDNQLASSTNLSGKARTHPAKTKVTKVKSNENKIVWSLDKFQVPPSPNKKRFHDFSLSNELMHAICDLGFQYCTPIQAEVLATVLDGHDTLGKAQTGTGKTAAFLLSILSQLTSIKPPSPRYLGEPRVLILAPTRELALQISKDAKALSRYLNLSVISTIGGIDYQKQLNKLQAEYVDILVATPGRLLDFYEKGVIHLDLIESLVIDEADMMLDMGFIPQVKRIVNATPRPGDRQTLLFSATFNQSVLELGQKWTWQAKTIEIEPDHVAADAIEQNIYTVSKQDKYPLLLSLIERQSKDRIIVFANRRDQVRSICQRLQKDGIAAEFLSGEIPQKKRSKTLEDFRSDRVQVLVATDVAGRGIHIDNINYVVNYNLPDDPEDYIHRIGRTGRAGAKGISISFACEDDSFQIPALEKLLGSPIQCEPPPKDLL